MDKAKSKENLDNGQLSATATSEPAGKLDKPRITAEAPDSKESKLAQTTVDIDDSEVTAHYANFCRVSSTPEELILDVGLNPNPFNATTTSVKVSQRIILNHFTAKRMLSALSMALQRHEQAFGVLETDVRKRVQQT